MADPLLAFIGMVVLFALFGGAVIALLIYSTQGFLALYRWLWPDGFIGDWLKKK